MTKTKSANCNDKLKAAHDKLQSAFEEIASGDDWRSMPYPKSVRSPSAATLFGESWRYCRHPAQGSMR
jgi:hypothetical protein